MTNKLYDYYRSSASFRVRIALNLKKIPYEEIPISLIKGEHHHDNYHVINPQGLVPTWVDTKITLSQSLAIMEYLDDCYPGVKLLPSDPILKAHARQLAYIIACEIHPLNNLRVKAYLKEDDWSDEKILKWYHHWLREGFDGYEHVLEKLQLHQQFSIGNQPTMADACLVPQIYNAHRFSFDMTPYPICMRIYQHCERIPAFINAWPNEPKP